MAEASSHRIHFDRDGFVLIPGFLSVGELSAFEANLERYKHRVVPTLEPYRALYDEIEGGRRLKQLVDMHLADPYFADWLYGEKAGSIAERLLGEEASPQTLEYFEKPARVGTTTPAHQDGYYFCLKPNHALTMWTALDDCDEENGCLHYVRGSHKKGVVGHKGSGVTGFSQGLDETSWEREDVTMMKVRAGDCIVHHSLIIHFADANKSDRQRRSFGMIFYSASAKRDEEAWARYQAALNDQRQLAAGES